MTSKELKVPLGDDLYISVSVWHGKPKIHIRKHVVIHSKTDPTKLVVVPTRFGVTLSKRQTEQLLVNMPLVVTELKRLSDLTNIPSSADVDSRFFDTAAEHLPSTGETTDTATGSSLYPRGGFTIPVFDNNYQ